ncbi:argininosuccinate lyase [Catenisphaera adipataccumulans]|jgi:argininosuccinate lyase|uniref:Argininosuccinate lyase n=1 Tax=Catenisphaera adipataccumulans TaxID=700500 RepID=A0A7W8CZV3_9FIRM|nr:argininosuccinate lyase [Catenisphaera adipataccumulans]MBB5183005.1 argininosuccinate lyase [Catenisphaera adipataccumulans]
MALWGARFHTQSDRRLDEFNSSIAVDQNMVNEDIAGSIAHVTMLAHQNIIDQESADEIVKHLKQIKSDIETGALVIDPEAEDIHMFIEGELTKRTPAGKKLHTARSRNDQVAVDFKMYAIKSCRIVSADVIDLINALLEQAEANTETIMPGYTHLQRAQPITFAHHLMAYVEMFKRDLSRLADAEKRANQCPLGCGALATTTYPIDREMTAELLGFDGPTLNSLDGVSDRDFAIEMVSAFSQIMMHLSRLCEEIILWCSWEFKYVELSDAFATGSSIMPQKKNPDVAELVRGKTGRVYGNLQTLLTMMKGLPLAYNKDMQEDKEAFMDSAATVHHCLITMTPMIETMRVLPENMRKAAAKGFINATDCADYLTKKGMAFRDAYTTVGQLVKYCMDHGLTLETLSLTDYQKASELFDEDVYDAIALETCVSKRKAIGGPAPETVKAHIESVKKELKNYV